MAALSSSRSMSPSVFTGRYVTSNPSWDNGDSDSGVGREGLACLLQVAERLQDALVLRLCGDQVLPLDRLIELGDAFDCNVVGFRGTGGEDHLFGLGAGMIESVEVKNDHIYGI